VYVGEGRPEVERKGGEKNEGERLKEIKWKWRKERKTNDKKVGILSTNRIQN
jgi:hypothetical protein